MSHTAQPVADTLSESHPAYSGQLNYVEGYDPVSYVAPHSSLLRARTWIGMGLILATLCPLGILTWVGGMSTRTSAAPVPLTLYLVVGLVLTACSLIGGIVLIYSGRSKYFKYRRETGRKN